MHPWQTCRAQAAERVRHRRAHTGQQQSEVVLALLSGRCLRPRAERQCPLLHCPACLRCPPTWPASGSPPGARSRLVSRSVCSDTGGHMPGGRGGEEGPLTPPPRHGSGDAGSAAVCRRSSPIVTCLGTEGGWINTHTPCPPTGCLCTVQEFGCPTGRRQALGLSSLLVCFEKGQCSSSLLSARKGRGWPSPAWLDRNSAASLLHLFTSWGAGLRSCATPAL